MNKSTKLFLRKYSKNFKEIIKILKEENTMSQLEQLENVLNH